MLTPAVDAPLELADMAPPAACRMRETMSQGMKIQYKSLGAKREDSTEM